MAEFNVKKIISDLVEKFKADPSKITELFEDPVKTVEKLLGIDLPDDKINKVVDGIKKKSPMVISNSRQFENGRSP